MLLEVLISLTSASSTVYRAFELHSFPVSSTQLPFACCWMISATLGAAGRLWLMDGFGAGSESPASASDSAEVRLPAWKPATKTREPSALRASARGMRLSIGIVATSARLPGS